LLSPYLRMDGIVYYKAYGYPHGYFIIIYTQKEKKSMYFLKILLKANKSFVGADSISAREKQSTSPSHTGMHVIQGRITPQRSFNAFSLSPINFCKKSFLQKWDTKKKLCKEEMDGTYRYIKIKTHLVPSPNIPRGL